MKVLKFGGTSVGSAERMQNVVRLISDGDPKIVVLSAMSGTTNSLKLAKKITIFSKMFSPAFAAPNKLNINFSPYKYIHNIIICSISH